MGRDSNLPDSGIMWKALAFMFALLIAILVGLFLGA